jgi:hypothetical protein
MWFLKYSPGDIMTNKKMKTKKNSKTQKRTKNKENKENNPLLSFIQSR